MAASYNRVILIGNLTRDIELKYLQSGTAIAEIGLAVNDKVKKGDQWVDETTFVDLVSFGRTAEIASEYLSKGSPALFEGRLKYESWEKDGQKRSKLKVVIEKLQLLGGKSDSGRSKAEGVPANQTRRAQKASEERLVGTGWGDGMPDDDVPF